MHIVRLIKNLKPLEYLDPGTGSYLVQMLVAALAGGAVAIGIYWKKLRNWMLKLLGREIEQEEDLDDEQ